MGIGDARELLTQRKQRKVELGWRLTHARNTAGLTQAQAASRAGVNRVTIAYAETGDRKVSAELVARLASVYGVSVNDLTVGPPDGEEDRVYALPFGSKREIRARLQSLDLHVRRISEELGRLRQDMAWLGLEDGEKDV